MDDVELVEAARRGDRGAFAAIYDAYAPRIHALCTRLLNEPHTAADATQDTFVVAAQRLDQLRDPAKLRAWLYAIARNECTRHGRARGRLVPVEEVADVTTAEVDDPGNRAAANDVAELLWAAAEGLDERDKVLLELNVRHGLEGQELAEAAGIAPGQISMATGRMRERIERSLGALLVARRGRKDCPGLDAVLAGWDGTFSVLMRKRVARHVERCEVCERKKAVLVAPLGSLALSPFLLPPTGLREQVLGAIDDVLGGGGSGSADGSGGSTATEVGPSVAVGGRDLPALHEEWPGGFPPPLPQPRRRSRLVAAAAVLLVVLLVAGGIALLSGTDDDAEQVATGPQAGATSTEVASAAPTTPTPTKATTTAPGATTTVDGTPTTTLPAGTTTAPGDLGTPNDPNGPTVPVTQPPIATPEPGDGPIVLNPPDTTLPAPNRPPSIGSVVRSGTATMQDECNPANAERTITATVADDEGVAAVKLVWSGAAAGEKAMGGGSTRSAILGRFPSGTAGTVDYRVVVTDTDGATTTSSPRSVQVDPCPG